MQQLIYLDYAATTPLDERVLQVMLPFLRDRFGNAASRNHELGRQAAEAVEVARQQVAAAIGADPREIIWTSGATESINLALLGVARSRAYAKRRHVLTVATEHKAVIDVCRHLESIGYDVTFLPVDPAGHLDLQRLDAAIRDDTLVVSVMHGNNEIGVLHPIGEIGRRCRERGVLFHTDATQTFGKLPIDVQGDAVDLMSVSAHKVYGPKGVGALYVRRRDPRVRCEPLIHGGGHERGLRSGTLNVPGVVGFGAAAELCVQEAARERPRIAALRELLEARLAAVAEIAINGAEPRIPGITNVSFRGIEAAELLQRLPEICASTSSACTSASLQPSYVLTSLGLDDARRGSSVRFSVGRFTTEAEIERAVERIGEAIGAG